MFSAAAAEAKIATGMPSASPIAASAAPDRAWYRPRSRRASLAATGARAAPRATARMASGLNISTPAIKASVPTAISTTWSVVALPPETLLPVARQTTPPTTKAAATRAERSSARRARRPAREGDHGRDA